jgi:hypothetical protein
MTRLRGKRVAGRSASAFEPRLACGARQRLDFDAARARQVQRQKSPSEKEFRPSRGSSSEKLSELSARECSIPHNVKRLQFIAEPWEAE